MPELSMGRLEDLQKELNEAKVDKDNLANEVARLVVANERLRSQVNFS